MILAVCCGRCLCGGGLAFVPVSCHVLHNQANPSKMGRDCRGGGGGAPSSSNENDGYVVVLCVALATCLLGFNANCSKTC